MNKLHNFSSFVYTSNYQIITVTETWLTSSIYNNEILPSNLLSTAMIVELVVEGFYLLLICQSPLRLFLVLMILRL